MKIILVFYIGGIIFMLKVVGGSVVLNEKNLLME